MRPLAKLEAALETAIEGLFASAFRSKVHPLDVARLLEKAMRVEIRVGTAAAYAPNEYEVGLSPVDLEALAGLGEELLRELRTFVRECASENGWRILGEPRIALVAETAAPAGRPRVRASFCPVKVAAKLRFRRGAQAGAEFVLRHERNALGRSPESDVPLLDAKASRRQAEILINDVECRLVDSGSRNGTLLNGQWVKDAVLHNGDVIGIGPPGRADATEIVFEEVWER